MLSDNGKIFTLLSEINKTMTIFKFYSFKNLPVENTAQLLDPNEGDTAQPADPDMLFGGQFATGGQFPLTVFKDVHEECDIYRCQVFRNDGGVVLMALENNRLRHTIIDLKDVVHEHHPFCLVIIDNRPGRQLIGIERNSSFGTNTDKVADILQKGLSYKMHEYRRRIEIKRPTKKTTDFWDVVDEIRNTFDDHVTKISIDFADTDGKTKVNANDLLAIMCRMSEKAGCKTLFEFIGQGNEGVGLDNIRPDMEHIAEICLAQPNYVLSVRFKNFGVYRYGADLVAQFCVDDLVAVKFAEGETIMDFETGGKTYVLVNWLNRLSELIKNNYKDEPLQLKRTRRSRR